ncbi:flippase [Acinetobacter colistiniresistens]|uniref:flippase n=1 Tax=Acinetobacter colistiniresistens TaxID=280145 RepID=UPI001D183698|nr:flippase [Acinetobacter colistiniresistens]
MSDSSIISCMSLSKFLKNKSVFLKNLISLATVQGLNYLLPLLTLPYLVRVVGVDKFGVLSLATVVIAFFIVVTDYGFNYAATREISLNKSNKKELVKIVNSVMTIKLFLTILSVGILALLIHFVHKFNEYALVYWLTFGSVIGQVLFPVWFFQGVEKMQFITVINVISKVLSTLSIFIFVKSPEDYFIVPVLVALGSIVGGIYSLYLIRKDFGIYFELQTRQELLKHVKGGSNLFLTTMLSTALTSSGLLILGFYASNTVVGLYAAIEKLFKAIVGLFAPITQALYPISCKQFQEDNDSQKQYLKKLISVMALIALVISSSVALFAPFIVEMFYGEKMVIYSYVLQVMMIWLFFSVMNNVLGIQYLSAKKLDKFYMLAFIVSGSITTLMNLILIPEMLIDGILYAMIIGEIILTVAMIVMIKGKKL